MKKYYYYVGVVTDTGIILVTSKDSQRRTAEWDTGKIPLEMSKLIAEDLSYGLFLNGNPAFVIRSHYPLDKQIGVVSQQ